jgi:GNAT superfamily N-acetyltransferase
MRIRLATKEDAAAISGLIRPLAAKFIAREFSPEGVENLLSGMTAEAVQQFLDAGFRYHVAEEGGDLLGVVATRDDRHLYHLFVAETFQRRGLAREMWAVARQACLDAGWPGAFTVNSSRYAVEVYKKLGFVEAAPPTEKDGVVFIPMRSEPPAAVHTDRPQ